MPMNQEMILLCAEWVGRRIEESVAIRLNVDKFRKMHRNEMTEGNWSGKWEGRR